MLSYTAFSISAFAALSIFALILASHLTERFQFWPPPSGKSWQHRSFNILFRVFLYALIVLSVLEFKWPQNYLTASLRALGAIITIAGFGLALWITTHMGWRNAFGERKGLITSGPFALSRNPVYVVTLVGLCGWALLIGSPLVSGLLIAWGLLYIAAPFLEEPWLEREYGEAYQAYKTKVRRFI